MNRKIRASAAALIAYRGDEMRNRETFEDRCKMIAKWLTSSMAQPGLLLYGTVGSGKSTFMKAIINVMSMSGKVCPVIKATELLNIHTNRPESFEFYKTPACDCLFVDDVGEEDVGIRIYGNEIYPLNELLNARYDQMLPTVFTSNLSDEGFLERYGDRFADRLKKFDRIYFEEESYR